jgi:aspartate/glutamate racemase
VAFNYQAIPLITALLVARGPSSTTASTPTGCRQADPFGTCRSVGHRLHDGAELLSFTIEQGFYLERLSAHGPSVAVPDATDRAGLHRIIFDELCRGIIADSSRIAYLNVIDRLVDRGCKGNILGCTEIELLLPMAEVIGIPLLPTTRLHVDAVVDVALESRPTPGLSVRDRRQG